MPSRPRFALCTAISPSHHCKQTSTPILPRATHIRPAPVCRPPIPVRPHSDRCPFSCQSAYPYSAPGPLRHTRASDCALLCCTAVTRNTHSTSPPCRAAAAADQTSPNHSLNQSIAASRCLPSPSRLRHPRLREWLDFPLPRSARPGSLHNHPVLQRKAHRAAAATARIRILILSSTTAPPSPTQTH